MSNLQPNCCLKIDFQKVDQYAGAMTAQLPLHCKPVTWLENLKHN